ncbi:hypothetical protein D9758_005296 [Tetrapyrgos nigripes]|uniref:Uncharacterized protein n=1 Tax=Tetrapyrgos nigripes TaxID=182062 RepID=A0A8H5GWW6_9AGAR|nr:hypothetical protein D9758_005296 [Tetrapyrgos nigripes]
MMKHTLFASSLVVFTNILGSVVADELTLYEVFDSSAPVPVPVDAAPTATLAAIPIGVADGATTYLIEAIATDSVIDTVITNTGTIVASAAGWKVTEPVEDGVGGGEIGCSTPDAQGNGECIERENLNGTTFAFTQTGSMFSFVLSVSPTGAADTGGSSGSSGSGSGNNNNTAGNGGSSGSGSGSGYRKSAVD